MAGPDNDNTTGDVVRLTQGEWERRAAVAEEAAALLAGAAQSLELVAKQNAFGDCVEGNGMHETMAEALAKFRSTVVSRAVEAAEISESCYGAAKSLQSADDGNGSSLF